VPITALAGFVIFAALCIAHPSVGVALLAACALGVVVATAGWNSVRSGVHAYEGLMRWATRHDVVVPIKVTILGAICFAVMFVGCKL
jgi:urea transporter